MLKSQPSEVNGQSQRERQGQTSEPSEPFDVSMDELDRLYDLMESKRKQADEHYAAMVETNKAYVKQYMVEHPHLVLLSDIDVLGIRDNQYAFDPTSQELWVAHVQGYALCEFKQVNSSSVAYSDVMRLRLNQDKDKDKDTLASITAFAAAAAAGLDKDKTIDVPNIDIACANLEDDPSDDDAGILRQAMPFSAAWWFIPYMYFMLFVVILVLAVNFNK